MDKQAKLSILNTIKKESTKGYVWRKLLELKSIGDEVTIHVPESDHEKQGGVGTVRSYVNKFRLLAGGDYQVNRGDFNYTKSVTVRRCKPKADTQALKTELATRVRDIKQRDSCKGFIFRKLYGIEAGESVQFLLPPHYNKPAATEAIRSYKLMCNRKLMTITEGNKYYIHCADMR